ncbi:MAG: hypothetical protein FJ255_02660 [Phycisphaerae bacterium]|nr:hypothetical protein [Phycisphaerae bacterium]
MSRLPVRTRLAALVLLAGVPVAALAQAPGATPRAAGADAADAADELPIRRITLYRSGVGGFERRGVVGADARIQLRVRTEQVNDILKSMVVLDLSGQGRIDNVAYGSKEPLARRLASFGIDLSDEPALGTILARLRGTPVTMTMQGGITITGQIIGGEVRMQAQGTAQQLVGVPYLSLLTPTGIQTLNLLDARAIRIDDPALKTELEMALAALAEHRADRTKAVEIVTSGPPGREIHVGYIHEMPVWKVSYRLVLPDTGPSPRGAAASVQGWAIVENTTDGDWNDVRLSLVSGRPVSFTMDLYQPLYIERPDLPVPQVAAALPRLYELSAGERPMDAMADARARFAARRSESVAGRPAAPAAAEARAFELGKALQSADRMLGAEEMTEFAARAAALAQESGEVFQYEIDAPVTIERQRSAMLPIINQGVAARRVSIYSRSEGGQHPMRGVDLTNTTSLQLLPGPVAVYDGAVYAGDAQIGHVSPNDSRLLSYAVDLETAVLLKDESSVNVQRLRIVSGVLLQTQQYRRTVTYEFTSKDAARGRTLVIEHPRDTSMTLVKPEKPAQETPANYRFELLLEPGQTASLPVIEERTDRVSLGLLDFDHPTLLRYQKEGKASEAVLKAFQDGQQRRAAIADAERRLADLEREQASISEDQNRIRSNMASIDRTSQLYTRYMQKLTEQETRLEELIGKIREGRDEVARLKQALADFVSRLTVE